MAQSGRANRARRPPEVALAGVEWRGTLSGVIPEAILEPGFAEALQRLFEARERRETLLDLAQFRTCVEHALAALLQRSPQVGLAARHVVVAFDKAVEEAGQLFAALGQFRDFMLAEDLDSRQHVPGREVRYFAPIIPNERRIRDSARAVTSRFYVPGARV